MKERAYLIANASESINVGTKMVLGFISEQLRRLITQCTASSMLHGRMGKSECHRVCNRREAEIGNARPTRGGYEDVDLGPALSMYTIFEY
jgi:hypothetical protein